MEQCIIPVCASGQLLPFGPDCQKYVSLPSTEIATLHPGYRIDIRKDGRTSGFGVFPGNISVVHVTEVELHRSSRSVAALMPAQASNGRIFYLDGRLGLIPP